MSAIAVLGLAVALAGEPASPPDGFVDLAVAAPRVRFDIRYASTNNFTGEVLPGYAAPGAWLRVEPARSLAAAQRELEAEGLGLLVFDAYRPLRATLAMVAWATRTGRADLLDDGYIARRSNHNRGTTVDLTLVDAATGAPLDMGTPFDTLDTRAHTRNATGEVAKHRQRLVEALRRHGFVNYWKEWWHFTWQPDASPPARDVPYGRDEVPEGAWRPPEGWDRPPLPTPRG